MNLGRFNTIAARLALCLAVVVALFSQVARAQSGMDQSMAAQFNAMINVTPAGTYETQAAKVISGGSFVYRPRVAQLRLLSVDPPRLRADCNGIDAYGGSLSFISAEAFINFLRNLAAAAPAYAFNMALSYLCKDCDQHLARIQKLAQDINALTINSCKIDAGDMMKKVKAIGDDIDDVSKSAKELGSHWAGLYNDAFGPRQPGSNATGQVADAAGAGNTEAAATIKRINVNIAAAAAQRASLSDWWGAVLDVPTRKEFNELSMSFTGSIVTKTMPTEEDANQKKDQTEFLPPLLKFSDFLNGGDFTVYKCPDTDCLIFPGDADSTQSKNLPSFLKKVTDILVGDAGVPGIIFRLNARDSAGGLELTPTQKTFISGLPGGVYAHLRELAVYPSAAETYARTLSSWIAAEMAYEYLAQVVQNARISAGKAEAKNLHKSWLDELDKIEMQISSDRLRYSDSLKAQQANLNIAQMMRENLSRATALGLRPMSLGPSN